MYLRGGEGLGLGQFNANLNIKSEYQKRSLAVTVTGRLPCYTIELESDKQMLKDRARYELPSGKSIISRFLSRGMHARRNWHRFKRRRRSEEKDTRVENWWKVRRRHDRVLKKLVRLFSTFSFFFARNYFGQRLGEISSRLIN